MLPQKACRWLERVPRSAPGAAGLEERISSLETQVAALRVALEELAGPIDD